MATSTFGKQFVLPKKNANNFVKEMTKVVSPTLRKDFESKFTREKDLQNELLRALK